MRLDVQGRTAWLVFALIFALASLLALAAARVLAPNGETEADKIEKIRAARVATAEVALKQQGGSRILLKVDTDALREAVSIGLRDDTRRVLRDKRIPFAGLAARDGGVEVRIPEAKDRERALSELARLSGAPPSSAGSIDVADLGEGLIRLTATESGFADRLHNLRQQSMEVIEERLRNFGVAAAGVQPDGLDRIRILAPGVKDPERLNVIFSKRARLTFRLVDLSMTAAEALQGNPPPAAEVLYELNGKTPYLLLKRVEMEGGDIIDVAPGFDQRTREPIVTFRFNANGARRFGQITQENVGRPFAIVFDNDVLSAPVIREPILGGSGQISGGFTLEQANTIAMLLRSGTLPGRLIVIEQQVVEPEGKAGKE